MANFDTSASKRESVKRANNLLELIQSIYASGKTVQTLLALYVANTDPAFTKAIDALFNASERGELNAMATAITSLVSDWEANHASALQG